MKIEEIQTQKEKTEVSIQQQQETQKKFLGRTRLIKGLTLFEFNSQTFEVRKAKYDSQTVVYNPSQDEKMTKVRKVTTKDNCIYITALNFNNLKRKVKTLYQSQGMQVPQLTFIKD